MDGHGDSGNRRAGLVLLALRICLSIVFGIACLILVVFWARSFKTCDMYIVRRGRTQLAGAVSFEGKVYAFTSATGRFAGRTPHSAPVNEVSFLNGAFVSNRPTFRVASGSVFIVASNWLVIAWVA